MSLLELKDLDAFYSDVEVLRKITLSVEDGEIVSIVGANCAGEGTLINAISGIKMQRGAIVFQGKPIQSLKANERVPLGIVQIPEGRRIFPFMTVWGNLDMGSFHQRARSKRDENVHRVFGLFFFLEERKNQLEKTLSEGNSRCYPSDARS